MISRTLLLRAVFVSVLVGAVCSSAAAPKITCAQPVYDFSRSEDTQTVEHTFIIGNTGDEPLRIGKIKACCGAATELGTNVIPAAGTTTLKVKLPLSGRSGNQHKSFYIGSNDPTQPYYQLRFVGKVSPRAKVEPVSEASVTVLPNPVTERPVAGPVKASACPVIVDYFFEEGCPDCERVRQEVLPELKTRFGGACVVVEHDIGIQSNVLMLVAYQEQLKIDEDAPVCMVVDYKYVFNGLAAIERGLADQVERCIKEPKGPGWSPPQPIVVPNDTNAAVADERMQRFTLSAVITAGLLDGINPCAFSTLVFFMSLLAVSKVRGVRLLMMGASFCLAVFVTYTAIGLGLLRALYLLEGLKWARTGLEALMMGVLAVLAFLSFRDAYRYRITGNAGDVTIQLPDRMKTGIRDMMRSEISPLRQGYGGQGGQKSEVRTAWIRLAVAGCVLGVTVTAIESVCTGQLYVPTLVLVAKQGGAASGKAWSYLLLYDAMFIVPLLAVFLLTYFGLRTQTLLAWSKHNVVLSKVLTGMFFLLMAVLICLL